MRNDGDNGADPLGLFEVVGRVFSLIGVPRSAQKMVAQVLWVLVVTLHIAWVCGYLEPLRFFPVPFADRAEVSELKTKLRDTQIDLYGNEIITLRIQQCHAQASVERASIAQQMVLLRRRFIEFTGREPYIPDCNQL